MTRIVKRDAKEPLEVTVGNESKFMCMCGLSKNGIFCDGTQKILQMNRMESVTCMKARSEWR